MSRLLHIVFLIVAALGFCLTAQQLHSVNHMAAARSLERQKLHQKQQQQQRNIVSGFVEVERPTSVQEGPPPAQVAQTSTAGGGMRDRQGAGGAMSAEDDGQQSQPRPTRVKTPAAETVLPTNTKVPVAAVSGAVMNPTSDPGFLALVASLGLMTIGMTLV
ncbi:hypothetical protein ISF_03886 [Cordyceps fumosorosea ARSEF 2679]|uniref:Uncharacterized protein n=1 Tax=Cordyceps fumosorosea (strain ARSEF 2679) TaxID=1081104 RepID=A0A162KCG8_CORFA|nr:hypothetical protein ISF_03886 [Cordyceps fumosorosea ARSEF 2679]OAA66048.1 hypothetical protein ISF_03886 [Cordyceps fumosorosea ARSEF 2679]